MAKKVVFLLVMMFVLLLATVTSFAAGTDSTTPEAGFTEDKANVAQPELEVSVSDLEVKYGDIFFGDVKSSKEIVTLGVNENGEIGKRDKYPYELRFTFILTALELDETNPLIMLMYIKEDGVYVPLVNINTGSNKTQKVFCLEPIVDLKYLGKDKVNEVRFIAFRKNDINRLTLENIQIIDIKKTVRPWNLFEKAGNLLKEIFN